MEEKGGLVRRMKMLESRDPLMENIKTWSTNAKACGQRGREESSGELGGKWPRY